MTKYLQSAIFLLFFFLVSFSQAWATHNRAGEITWEFVSANTVRVKVAIYAKFVPGGIDRPFLVIRWGDGTDTDTIARTNGPLAGGIPSGVFVSSDLKYNEYVRNYTYPGTGHYRITVQDPNREAGICNVDPPFSVNVPFFLQTSVTIRNPQFGAQNSPVLFQPPLDDACVGQPFKHNPGAFDPDNDSLAFRLAIPLERESRPVDDYRDPQTFTPGPNNVFTIDEVTGDICWDSPQEACTYNIAILIIDYRNGIPLDTVLRDMQIIVRECDNQPPEVETVDEICVLAGETIEFDVQATDPDVPKQLLLLTATGGPFELDISPATFTAPIGYASQIVEGQFRWETTCEHISAQPYFVVFRAKDTLTNGSNQALADLKTVSIKVVGPPPEDVQAEPDGTNISVSWELPYVCENVADDYFRGFSVWRRIGSNPFVVDSCTPGLDGRGYTRIERFSTANDGNRYFYEDEGLERGRTYCYRVMAEFANIVNGPVILTFNNVDGLPSEEICLQLAQDAPLLINVDVEETDLTNGEVFVRWVKPNPDDLDTLQNPGPYRYALQRAVGLGGAFTEVFSSSAPSLTALNDTFFTDTGLNTLEQPHTYRIDFFVENGRLIENNATASSIFLEVISTDNTNSLVWEADVPWTNAEFIIYRQLPGSSSFDSLTTVFENTYSDVSLTNGLEYCYYVQGVGSYNIEELPEPLLNKSQRACGIPIDTMPPCAPELSVTNQCDEAGDYTTEDNFINNLEWTNPNLVCDDTDDAIRYRVYFQAAGAAGFELIEELNDNLSTFFEHKPDVGIAGCYTVTAIDSVGNESARSNIVCVENCPFYALPNAFTPNGDMQNDLFRPYPYRFIERIELNVFNRWGQKVFMTEDPEINWNGEDMSGNKLTQGTYFYTCKLFERRADGSIVANAEVLSGFIELVRGDSR